MDDINKGLEDYGTLTNAVSDGANTVMKNNFPFDILG